MNPRHLHYFVTLAETKHFTRAAEKLHIAQPALSIAIKKLEHEFDLQLFRRNERQVSLTSEGSVLLTHARRILQQIDGAKLAMAELKGLEKGEVKLGMPNMLGSYYFPEILIAFKRRYPNIRLTLVEAGSHSIRKKLCEGELDLGIISSDQMEEELLSKHLFSSEITAVVGRNHRFSNKSTLTFDEFFQEELAMFKSGYFHREYIDAVCKQYDFLPKYAFETNLLPMILSAVRHDFAITALLKMVADHEDDIVSIPFANPIRLDIAISWRKRGYLSVAERAFIEFLTTEINKK
ncbi:LysR family transcriptional regulator [Endozoicomonas montiporae]|uniref:LysR family transcriptional regulator n=2 Tax=Endozoicomonas montiporae TaxID=1027273 RepID=A0A081N2Y8_9GAMM|nr:LysR substrate-binding domain-containing protein [Endozoicomonas montiporae]AMO58079.1 LysR family substrate binding transcriptional regulator [Endozoicomonas montiporae CL-33]KEQ12811.1 LysR family transcriptional regulator [Endozoicomonas montiporae]